MKKHTDKPAEANNEESALLNAQVEEWKTKYVRALADYHNLEKRTSERISEVRQFAAEVILSRLLPVVDTFAKVNEHIKDPGLVLANKELLSVLSEQGVKKIDVMGHEFDPTQMDCIEVINGEDDKVLEEVQPGYLFRGKVLRVARVKVGKSESINN